MSDSCTVPDICFFDDVEPVITKLDALNLLHLKYMP